MNNLEMFEAAILIVDDQYMNSRSLEQLLKKSGYFMVKSINDSRKVVEMCEEFEPDVILLDLNMPHIDGFTLMEQLRATPKPYEPAIIVMTAYHPDDSRQRALYAGAQDFITKPFDRNELLTRLTSVLRVQLRRKQAHRTGAVVPGEKAAAAPTAGTPRKPVFGDYVPAGAEQE